MHMLHMHTLIWYERDPLYRFLYRSRCADDVFAPPVDRARKLIHQHNPLFNFMYAADKPLGPSTDGPAYNVVRDGICMLPQFPASTHENTMECPPASCGEPVCDGRRRGPAHRLLSQGGGSGAWGRSSGGETPTPTRAVRTTPVRSIPQPTTSCPTGWGATTASSKKRCEG